jgi:hypothetical protein
MGWIKRAFVSFLVVWQLLLTLFLTLAGMENRQLRAMAGMLWGLNVLWIGGAGLLTLLGRDKARDVFRLPPRYFGLKFFLLFTLLALIEEAIATLMTNCAPLFGVPVGEVYITASADYLDVVVFHSVVVFLPQFAAWAWLLSRYAFSPFAVFVLFGLTGLINETLFAGPQLLTVAQWLLVYGLMAYLPAYCYPEVPDRIQVRWWHYPAAVILPIIAALPMVAMLLLVIAPGHPSIHFPPMGAK